MKEHCEKEKQERLRCGSKILRSTCGPIGTEGMKGMELAKWESIKEQRQKSRGKTVGKDCRIVVTIHLVRYFNVC